TGHEVSALLRLGERDYVAQALRVAHEERDAVHSERDAAMRRRAVGERFEQEAEFVARFVFADTERAKHLLLHLGVVQPNGSAAELESIEHEIVAITEDFARIAFEQADVLVERAGKRVMRRYPRLQLFAVFKKRRAGHPKEFPLPGVSVFRDKAHFL